MMESVPWGAVISLSLATLAAVFSAGTLFRSVKLLESQQEKASRTLGKVERRTVSHRARLALLERRAFGRALVGAAEEDGEGEGEGEAGAPS